MEILGRILFSGFSQDSKPAPALESFFHMTEQDSTEDALNKDLLKEAEIFLLGPHTQSPVKDVQNINAADNHIAIILLAIPSQFKSIKGSIQFAPYVGNNTLVVSMGPELDLLSICKLAAQRTKQKRSFHNLGLAKKPISVEEKKIVPEQLGAFLDYAPIGAILLNDLQQVVTYNGQAKKFFPNLAIASIGLSHLFPKEVEEGLRSFLSDRHNPEERREFIVGQKIMEVTSSEVINEEGQKHFLLLFNDVTDQRQEVNRIRAILEALPQMAWTTHNDGRVNYFTQSWYYYTGQTKEEAKGLGWLSVIYEDDRKKISEQWLAAVESGRNFQQAARYRNNKGEYRWHLARASSIKNNRGEVSMWVGTCTDIHDQILLTEELERKVNERTKSLQESNSELEQFAHVSSHDLQEPLRKIRVFAELLKERSYENLDEASRKYIDKISGTAERMSASLKALLNFTKLHREEKLKPVDLSEVVAHVLVDLELMVSQKGAELEVQKLPVIQGIEIQMQQLFYNLLNNALKFTRPGETPKIKVGFRELEEQELVKYPQLNQFREYIEITVEDNGIGFEQEYAEKIFTIFQRLHKKDYEGTGIGLSLVKKIVNNHKGEIRVESRKGEGTKFFLILPGKNFQFA